MLVDLREMNFTCASKVFIRKRCAQVANLVPNHGWILKFVTSLLIVSCKESTDVTFNHKVF